MAFVAPTALPTRRAPSPRTCRVVAMTPAEGTNTGTAGVAPATTAAPARVAKGDTPPPKPLHIHTPLIESPSLTAACGRRVLLKLDNLQPGGSFKMRGHGHLVRTLSARDGVSHFVSSSGGNAGAAVAEAGRLVGARVTIFVPTSTPAFMRERLVAAGARVRVEGDVWDRADAAARALAETEGASAVHVSPFDHPLLWDGHASVVDEVRADLDAWGIARPAAVAVAVGGGGLLLGTVEGLRRNGWDADVVVIAGETEGADSFARAASAGRVVCLERIDSIAKSLGALAVSQHCVPLFDNGDDARAPTVWPTVVSDAAAVEMCSLLAVRHRFLVEPACGAALAAAVQAGPRLDATAAPDAPLVIVVCGGNMASPALLADWVEQTGAKETEL